MLWTISRSSVCVGKAASWVHRSETTEDPLVEALNFRGLEHKCHVKGQIRQKHNIRFG